MDRRNIEKIAKTPEDSLLLAKLWDKIQTGMRKNVPANTCFLTPREQELANFLFGNTQGLCTFGGYEDSERKMIVFLPDYLDSSFLLEAESPVACLQINWYAQDTLSHRDFLGALMGAGIARESIGDICVAEGSAIVFVASEIAPYLLENFSSAGRTKLHIEQVSAADAQIPTPEYQEIRDTVASIRLDSIISSGFRIGRSLASQYVCAGKAAIDGLPCEKPDKPVPEGAKISVRGLGKIRLAQINGKTKKDRFSVTIQKYI